MSENLAALIEKGWVQPVNGSRWHYVLDGKTLCGANVCYVARHEYGSGVGLPNRCPKCAIELQARQA